MTPPSHATNLLRCASRVIIVLGLLLPLMALSVDDAVSAASASDQEEAQSEPWTFEHRTIVRLDALRWTTPTSDETEEFPDVESFDNTEAIAGEEEIRQAKLGEHLTIRVEGEAYASFEKEKKANEALAEKDPTEFELEWMDAEDIRDSKTSCTLSIRFVMLDQLIAHAPEEGPSQHPASHLVGQSVHQYVHIGARVEDEALYETARHLLNFKRDMTIDELYPLTLVLLKAGVKGAERTSHDVHIYRDSSRFEKITKKFYDQRGWATMLPKAKKHAGGAYIDVFPYSELKPEGDWTLKDPRKFDAPDAPEDERPSGNVREDRPFAAAGERVRTFRTANVIPPGGQSEKYEPLAKPEHDTWHAYHWYQAPQHHARGPNPEWIYAKPDAESEPQWIFVERYTADPKSTVTEPSKTLWAKESLNSLSRTRVSFQFSSELQIWIKGNEQERLVGVLPYSDDDRTWYVRASDAVIPAMIKLAAMKPEMTEQEFDCLLTLFNAIQGDYDPLDDMRKNAEEE